MEERKQKEIEYYDNQAENLQGFEPSVLTSFQFLYKLLKDRCQDKVVLDYGCGKGEFSRAPKYRSKIKRLEYDPAIRGKESASPADLVIALDVMEHIEPECLTDVIQHIHGLTGKCFYCSIAVRPSKKMLADGRNAHLIVQPGTWWLSQLYPFFHIIVFAEREDKLQYTFECVPRKAKANGTD